MRPVIRYVAWRRWLSSTPIRTGEGQSVDIEQLLAKPSWSVASLIPAQEQLAGDAAVTSEQLRHLLRLSALPPPKDEAEEVKMLETLSSQLHFVRAIQNVDTNGVEPLRSIRDETTAGRNEAEISLETLKDALAQEDVIGVYHKRIRRRRGQQSSQQAEKWDVLGNAEKKVGRYFVVESGKD